MNGDLDDRLIQALQTKSFSDHGNSVTYHEADVITHGGECHNLQVISSESRLSTITRESLAQRWFTGLDAAKQTLLATTQEGMRFIDGPIEQWLKTSQAHLRFPSLVITLYSDTLFSHTRSVRGICVPKSLRLGMGL